MSNRIFRAYGPGLALLLACSILLAACGDATPTRETFPTPSPNPNTSKIVAAAPPGPVANAKLDFPQDEAPHNVITEWWYYTGHLTTDDGQQYGFEYVIFQGIRGDLPPGYVSHFAVTDLGKQNFKFDQKILASTRPIQFGSTTGFNLNVGEWTMQGLNGTDKLKARMNDGTYGLDLTAKDTKGLVLHGSGLFSYGAAGSSYYYSRPRMAVSGTLTVGTQTKTVKEGLAWFDHQWGNFIPLSGGWDWFSLQLSDNTELMVYYLRDDKNNVLDVFGSYVPACDASCDPASDKRVKGIDLRREDFVIKPTGQWTSPNNGGVYPSGWNVQVKSKDAPALDLNVKPVLPNQELLTRNTTGVTYWEGACTVSGTRAGQPITGQSYVELTGYAKNS